MSTWSFYDATTGAINPSVLTTSDDTLVPLNTPANGVAIPGAYINSTQRFDFPTQAVVSRGACPVTSSVAARVVTLSGVPSGAAYSITGDGVASGTADSSGTLTLTFGAAGTYNVAVTCFPLLDYQGSFTLT